MIYTCKICGKEIPVGRVLCSNKHCAFIWQLKRSWDSRPPKSDEEYFISLECRRTGFIE